MSRDQRTRLLAVLVVAALAATLLGACGDSGSSSGSDQFRDQTESPLLDFGAEGSESELEEASEVVSDFLAARSEKDWEAVCDQLSKATVGKLENLAIGSTSLEDQSCPALLESFLRLSPQEQRESPEIDDASLRYRGAKGYLIYGSGEVVFAMPLDRAGETWKVAAIIAQRLS